jgi:hypothetical protein
VFGLVVLIHQDHGDFAAPATVPAGGSITWSGSKFQIYAHPDYLYTDVTLDRTSTLIMNRPSINIATLPISLQVGVTLALSATLTNTFINIVDTSFDLVLTNAKFTDTNSNIRRFSYNSATVNGHVQYFNIISTLAYVPPIGSTLIMLDATFVTGSDSAYATVKFNGATQSSYVIQTTN